MLAVERAGGCRSCDATHRRTGDHGETPASRLADDNADMRDDVQRLLSDRCDGAVVATSEEALAGVRQLATDGPFSDGMMPHLDQRRRTAPILLPSARPREESRRGVHSSLVKPVDFDWSVAAAAPTDRYWAMLNRPGAGGAP
jgi:hypothetical protein